MCTYLRFVVIVTDSSNHHVIHHKPLVIFARSTYFCTYIVMLPFMDVCFSIIILSDFVRLFSCVCEVS